MYNYADMRGKTMNARETAEKVIDRYKNYFDINRYEAHPLGLIARCDFHVHNEKFVLIKKAKLWETYCHEYAFVFAVSDFSPEFFRKCEEYVLSQGDELIKPGPGHMYTYITAIFVCDRYEKDAVKLLKKASHCKNYRFSFYGWSDFRAVVLKADDKTFFCNKNRKEFAKFIKNI